MFVATQIVQLGGMLYSMKSVNWKREVLCMAAREQGNCPVSCQLAVCYVSDADHSILSTDWRWSHAIPAVLYADH